jgi:hypothetical protein
LTDSLPIHWTGATHALVSIVRVDGRAYRIMGDRPQNVPALEQVGCRVLPTRTIYDFQGAGVCVTLTFTTPMLPSSLDLIARPISYLTWDVRSIDGVEHDVALYYDNSAELVVHEGKQQVAWSRPTIEGLSAVQIGTQQQPVLQRAGDDTRIDWGYLYVAVPSEFDASPIVADADLARKTFAEKGELPKDNQLTMPRAANDRRPAVACQFALGQVGAEPVSRHLLLAYDDEYSIEYLGQKLRPYWRRNGMDAVELLKTAAGEYADLRKKCENFDAALTADLCKAGGPRYAELCALAYREAIGGHKLAALPDGRPALFAKECASDGDIATVDVIYPAAPIFALLSSDLLKASVTPIFEYAATGRWKFPFAPHDLGFYPKANGQVYGGGERTEKNQMPVEESGNMLILAAVICQIDGNTAYVERYWPQLARWAEYVKAKGLDPSNQLCTDDFAGHLAHNANLSIKAIVAMRAYAKMCEMAGKTETAAEYQDLSESFAAKWVELADGGDHFRLAFDRPDTWSQKYNLVWDKLLDLRLFDPAVAAKEIAFYKTKLQPFGLPLDSRKTYTKLDWQVWTATLADSQEDFETLMSPVYEFVSHTEPRVPMTDWYETTNARLQAFKARPVVGGLFIKALSDPTVWQNELAMTKAETGTSLQAASCSLGERIKARACGWKAFHFPRLLHGRLRARCVFHREN